MYKKIIIPAKLVLLSCLFCFFVVMNGCTNSKQSKKLDVQFKGLYGQLEVGGKYAGVEFHKSRPLPSRISFYYPVANSIDLSTDYWKRYESLPLNFLLKSGNQTDSLGKIPYPYTYAPYKAEFKNIESNLEFSFSYNFCEDLPVVILKIKIKNISDKIKEFELQSHLNTTIRTSHTYSSVTPGATRYLSNNSIARATYAKIAADSSLLFVVNAGDKPSLYENEKHEQNLVFSYLKNLAVNEEFEIIQLIGMCWINEQDSIINEAKLNWRASSEKYEKRVLDYTFNQAYFNVNDSDIMQTVQWSKALIATNTHYLDGKFMPMPCPAEYNFFFTHDLLLTSLGAVYYDLDYVKTGFQYLKSLSEKDSVLAHARYWKDDHYQIEFCNSDNWNHLWFIILASSYLKHSSDTETIRDIFPIISKSLHMMLQNKGKDDLMYAKRPDWWDIGNIYGARAYISILMFKVLRDYVYIAEQLNLEQENLPGYLELSEKIKSTLVEKLWDEQGGYLFNMMDEKTVDKHFYAGSILAVHYNLLDAEKKDRLLETVRKELVEENIGVRNAMPHDFHKLITEYKFNGMEVGLPYFYFNGGVWPHNNIWYILALNSNNNTEEAKRVIKKYMTIKGILNSPNGIPSFYEYRITDPNSVRYGEIDKPTFLWAGGFFLQAIYQIAGLHENSFNINFRPNVPQGFENAEYDLSLFGKLCRVKWHEGGKFFKKIMMDGKEKNSAIVTSSVDQIDLELGVPERPYLAEANCKINTVRYDDLEKTLLINFSGQKNQLVNMNIVSPVKAKQMKINNIGKDELLKETIVDGVFTYSFDLSVEQTQNNISIIF